MKFFFVTILVLVLHCSLWAKRASAPYVKDIVWKNIKISAYRNFSKNAYEIGIVLLASDQKIKVPILSYSYNKNLEKDVQDIYINEMNIKGEYVEIKTESYGIFLFYPESKKIFCAKIPQGKMLDIKNGMFIIIPQNMR